MRNRLRVCRWALLAAAPALGGCWEVIGEPFTGYTVDAGAAPMDAGDAGTASSSSPKLDQARAALR